MSKALPTHRREWRILGFSVVGLTAATTVLTFFLPVRLAELTDSRFAIGAATGIEGALALTVPLLVGRASDQTRGRFGRRRPYLLLSSPLIVAGLLGVALTNTYWSIVASVGVFFLGYYAYYTAYQALYPDLLHEHEYGRAWAHQSVWQGVGVGLALLCGGALLGVSLGAPFFAATGLFLAIAVATQLLLREPEVTKSGPRSPTMGSTLNQLGRRLREDSKLRWFLITHFCWEYTLAAIRAFVLLYLLEGLGKGQGELVIILTLVIIIYLIASLVSGQIADRFDPRRYTLGVATLYAISTATLAFSTNETLLNFSFPFGMFAGAAVLMLSYPILLRITPADRRGEYTGYYQANRGLALIAGTALTGAFIDQFSGVFSSTAGYQAVWLACLIVLLPSLFTYRKLTAKTV